MLSCEKTNYSVDAAGRKSGGGEISWSLGEYVYPDEIQAKFKLPSLKRPDKAGACEPNPHQGWGKRWFLVTVALIVLTIILCVVRPDRNLVVKTSSSMEPPRQLQ